MPRFDPMRTSPPKYRHDNQIASVRLAPALGGKLVVSNAFDPKGTPSHRVGIMPCYCDRGTTPQDAAKGIVLAAIGAAITYWRQLVHLAGITE